MVQVWRVPGALYLCRLGAASGAVMNIDLVCPGVCCTGAALMGWLEFLWAKGPGLTEEAGRLWCRELAPIQVIKVEGEGESWCSPAPPTQSSSSSLTGGVLGQFPLYSSCFFKLQLFRYVSGHMGLV